MERNGVVRRFRPADGARLGAPRPHVAGDPRGPLDRFPPARAARDARAAGPDVRLHLAGSRGGGTRTGVGGGRVLDRALVADRPRREPRCAEVLRVALSSGSEAPGRGGLPLDLRAERPRPPRRGGAGGAHAARLHAEVRRVPRRGSGLPDPRAAALGGRARRRPRGSGHARGRQGRPGGRPRGGRRGTARLSDAVPEARVLLADAQGVEVARGGRAELHPEPRALVGDRSRARRDGAPADLPAPDAARVWWQDAGVHQNLTFPVQPDPVSGQHCWHQKVTVARPGPDDRYGDVVVDTNRSFEVYREWLRLARPASGPGNLRRPLWLPRALKPDPSAYLL